MDDLLVTQNMGLVHMCAKRFIGRGVEYEDLFQIGCVGLVKASKNFEVERGLKFSTYAVPVILGEIKGFLRSDGIVKISRSVKELYVKIKHVINKFSTENGYVPTVNEIAEILDVSTEDVVNAMSACVSAVSLTMESEDGVNQFDIPVQSREEEITDKLSLIQVLENLEEKERYIINLRYFKNKTQSEVASLMGCSQVQISRKEKKILLKIREFIV